MRYSDITESLNVAVPFKCKKTASDKGLTFMYDFRVGESRYYVRFQELGDDTDQYLAVLTSKKAGLLNFDKATIKATGEGNAHQVLSTVVAIMDDMMTKVYPIAVGFDPATMGHKKLYEMMMRRYLPRATDLGYMRKEMGGNRFCFYKIKRNDKRVA